MLIKQLSVFLENKPGRLCAAIDELSKNGVNISALSLADTSEFGILRLIVDDPHKAKRALTDSGVVVCVNSVVAVAMDDAPGGAGEILHTLADAGLNVEYMYACVGKISGKALMVIRVDDENTAEKTLIDHGFSKINPADIYRI